MWGGRCTLIHPPLGKEILGSDRPSPTSAAGERWIGREGGRIRTKEEEWDPQGQERDISHRSMPRGKERHTGGVENQG